MKILQVGLGSMGQRRIRCLKKLGYHNIVGYDPREDRRQLVESKYNIETVSDWSIAKTLQTEAWIISTPPDTHIEVGLQALDNGSHFFAEAGVDQPNFQLLKEKLEETKLVGAASSTMQYFFGPKKIKEIVSSGRIGKPLLITYQSGQYLPDWHPWESYKDFYVSKRHTGACREIVPFELTWMIPIFGKVAEVTCMKNKLSDLDADIDDVYQLLLNFESGLSCHLLVDVIARPAVRMFRLCGSEGSLEWDHQKNEIRIHTPKEDNWEIIPLETGNIEKGYLHQEEPYVDEMNDFMSALLGKKSWNDSFEQNEEILNVLLAAEKAADTGVTQKMK